MATHDDAAIMRTVVDPRTGVEFVVIPKGEFMMGSPESEGGDGDERPQHRVELDAFELARTPVTNAQYRRYLEANPDAPTPLYWADIDYNRDNQPVVGVSWHDAMAYCTWAGFVLPTEAQWEYACRANTNTHYCSGDDEADLDRFGWYAENSQGRLHAVAEKQPNAWGLHDMHGNVWEWCRDGHDASYDQPVRAGDGLRREPYSVDRRVMRGGSFVDSADFARSAFRYVLRAADRNHDLGMRPARVSSGGFTTSPPTPSP